MPLNFSKETRKQQLLKASIEVFGRKGYHQTQISDIIAKAKVARGTFYLYFDGKREIFDTIMTELFERVQSEIRSIPKEAVAEIPSQILGNIQRVAEFLIQKPLLAKILFNESVGIDKELDERLRKFYGQLLDLIQRGLRQGQEMGFVRKADISILAICLLGCVKETFYQYLLCKGERPFAPTDLLTKEIFRLVIHGIAQPELIPTLENFLTS